MIAVKNLSHFYGRLHALKNANFTIPFGSVAGLIGPNGAGKSTTLRILSCFLVPTEGNVQIDGLSLAEHPMEVRKKIGYVPETPGLYKEMKVSSFLDFVAVLKEVSKASWKIQKDEILEMCGLAHIRSRLLYSLSKGNRQRVAFAQALVGSPTVLLLDEPTSALDPAQTIEMREFIRKLAGKVTVVITSHILSEISQLCNYIILIRNGEVGYNGHISEVCNVAQPMEMKEAVLHFTYFKDEWFETLGRLPCASVVKGKEVNTVKATVSNEEIFYPSLFEFVYNSHLPLREIRRDVSNLEMLFKTNK